MELSTNVTDYAFEADTGDDGEEEDTEQAIFEAVLQAAYEVGLLHYVMVRPTIGLAQ